MNRSCSPDARHRGHLYSTGTNRAVLGRDWGFWYLQRSKRVWFRLPDQPGPAGPLLFRYDGRPILHRSELAAWQAHGHRRPRPVLWGKWPAMGVTQGPGDTQVFLTIWSRWSWLHPQACGRPQRFSVERLPG